jgi:serine/threonine-protein kinase
VVTAVVESINEVVVPDLTGIDRQIIPSLLEDAYLRLGEESWRLSSRPEGTVIAQTPEAGASVGFEQPIDLVFSAAALVPDLAGLTPDEAAPALGNRSLSLGQVKNVFSIGWPGTIVRQRPAPDSPVARGGAAVNVEVVGLTGPLARGGGLLLARTGFVWYRARQSAGGGHAAPPPV